MEGGGEARIGEGGGEARIGEGGSDVILGHVWREKYLNMCHTAILFSYMLLSSPPSAH